LSDKKCVPCEMAAAAGIIVTKYCKLDEKKCDELRDAFIQGQYSLRELGKMLGADKEIMQLFEKDIDLDAKFKPS